ncbi:MAG: hypothetical protein GC185_06105 [Alphaproteobacteria bacterium]|nr:hypothetical protein [Alphaproteobacteria bacterium]
MNKDAQNSQFGEDMEHHHPEALEYHHAYLSGHFNFNSPRQDTTAQQPQNDNGFTAPKTTAKGGPGI